MIVVESTRHVFHQETVLGFQNYFILFKQMKSNQYKSWGLLVHRSLQLWFYIIYLWKWSEISTSRGVCWCIVHWKVTMH